MRERGLTTSRLNENPLLRAKGELLRMGRGSSRSEKVRGLRGGELKGNEKSARKIAISEERWGKVWKTQ